MLHRSRIRRLAGALACLGLSLPCGGCGPDAAVRPGDIRAAVVASGDEPATRPWRPASPAATAPEIRYEIPAGWTDRGRSGPRLATLAIPDAAGADEVTVVPAAGTLRANVDRWLGQLPGFTDPAAREAALERALAAAEQIEVDGSRAVVVDLRDGGVTESAAEGEAILGAMIPVDGTLALFVKYKGPAAVARRERPNFLRFVSSLRWK